MNTIGTVVVECRRCAGPVRVEVLAEVAPIQKPGSWPLRMVTGGEERGTCYVLLKPGVIDHQCPPPRGRMPLARAA